MAADRHRLIEFASFVWSVAALALPLGVLVFLLSRSGSLAVEQTVIEALIKIVAVVGLYVFIGNSVRC